MHAFRRVALRHPVQAAGDELRHLQLLSYEKENHEQTQARRHSATAGRQQHQTVGKGEGRRPHARRARLREVAALTHLRIRSGLTLSAV